MDEGHLPVLLDEVIEMLAPAAGSLHIDTTLGGGGHTERILEAANPDGRLLGLDADPAAIARVEARLRPRFGDRLVLRQANFGDLATVAPAAGFGAVDGCLFDLGLSSFQLADTDRGFGFRAGGPLDMRFDTSRGVPAAELLSTLDAGELTALFRRYGEEPKAPRIARAIVEARRVAPVSTAEELAALVERVAPPNPRIRRRTHPATRVFQALRIAVNQELEALQAGLAAALDLLRPGGRLVVAQLPLARGPDRQAVLPGRAAWLRLPARDPGLRLRPQPAPAPRDQPVDHPDGRRDRRQPPSSERPTAGRRASRRIAPHRKEEPKMSKRHTSSRRKTYGRRQHEVRERQDRGQHSEGFEFELGDWGSGRPRPTRSASSIRAVRASASRSATDRWPSTRAPVLAPSDCRVPGGSPRDRPSTAAGSVARSGPGAGRTGSGSCSGRSSWRSCWRSSRSPSRSASRRPGSTSGGSSSSARTSTTRRPTSAPISTGSAASPAIRKQAIDAGLGQLSDPIVLTPR